VQYFPVSLLVSDCYTLNVAPETKVIWLHCLHLSGTSCGCLIILNLFGVLTITLSVYMLCTNNTGCTKIALKIGESVTLLSSCMSYMRKTNYFHFWYLLLPTNSKGQDIPWNVDFLLLWISTMLILSSQLTRFPSWPLYLGFLTSLVFMCHFLPYC
jgi:hypothetical protein